MKATALFFVSLALWLLISSVAYAADVNWHSWRWDCRAYAGTTAGSLLHYGVHPYAQEGYDSEAIAHDTDSAVHAGVYHENGTDGWSGPTGFYAEDTRSPIPLVPGASKSWLVYLWADPGLDSGVSWMRFDANIEISMLPPRDFRYTLTLLKKPDGIEDGPEEGTVCDMSYYTFEWGAGFVLPAYRTTDGCNGYLLELKATAVPEPASLLALAAGLAGLVIRRRR